MESELSITYDELLLEVASFLGYGSDSALWSADQLSECDRYVQAGVRRFYYPSAVNGVEDGYPWSFLTPVTTMATVADDAAQDLPSNLGRVVGNFHFDESEHRRSIVPVSEQRYMELISRDENTGPPEVYRVRHKAKAPGVGQRLEVAWYPIPDAVYTLTYEYEAYNGKLAADNKYPLGGMRHAEVIVESCLAIAEQRANDERGLHTEQFERAMAAAVMQDRRLSARHFGHMGGPGDDHTVPRHGETGVSYDITYNGTTY